MAELDRLALSQLARPHSRAFWNGGSAPQVKARCDCELSKTSASPRSCSRLEYGWLQVHRYQCNTWRLPWRQGIRQELAILRMAIGPSLRRLN
jgi:hypothetical protein